jgi:acyl-CoA synthetase (AMP-forming)/AMP-acid ligase II
MTLDDLLARGTAQHPAIAMPDGPTLSFDSLTRASRALGAALLERGFAPGDRICGSYGNGAAILAAFFGTASARMGFAPLNAAYTEDEFRFYLDDIAPKAVLLAPGTVPAARAAAEALGIAVIAFALDREGRPVVDDIVVGGDHAERAHDDDIALFLHTSGTTSRPKGVPLSHGNLTTSASNMQQWYEIVPTDVSLCVMPLFHVHGLVFSTLAVLYAGGTVVIPERFSASAFWPIVREYNVTIVSAVPTIYRTLMLRADQDAAPKAGEHGLRFMRSSSAPLPAIEMERLEARFGSPVIEAYSMTEACHQMAANPLHGERRPGSVGMGAFVDVAVLDEHSEPQAPGFVGEVAVRGKNVTRGYHNNEAANASAFTNGWFRTGDYGMLDEKGYLTLTGRLKEMINRGGEKISPLEIDDAMLAHPGVIEGVAFGAPDEKYGEVVHAAVVLRDGHTVEDVLDHVRGRLASFKVPVVLHAVAEIPKTATGKVQRRVVAAAFTPATTA